MTELSDVIERIYSNACELETVLLSEAESLKQANSAEQLEAIATRKMDLVQTLDQLALRRKHLLEESADVPQQNHDETWQDTLAILSRCQRLNQQAGADIAVQSRHKQRALEILGTTHTETSLYSASGTTQYVTARQALGKA